MKGFFVFPVGTCLGVFWEGEGDTIEVSTEKQPLCVLVYPPPGRINKSMLDITYKNVKVFWRIDLVSE